LKVRTVLSSSSAYDSNNIERDTIFLTSRGVYRILYSSKKEIAKQFRKWVGDILDDLIFNQGKELKLQLEKYHLELEEKNKLLFEQAEIYTKEKEQIWKNSFRNKYVVYLIIISENLIKYGYTKDFDGRLTKHKADYGKNIQIAFIIESKNNELLETLFENNEKIKPNKIPQKFNGDNKTELIKIDKDLTLKNIIYILTESNKLIDTLIEIQILKRHNIDVLNYTQKVTINNEIEKITKNKKQNDIDEIETVIPKKIYIKKKQSDIDELENNKKIIKEFIDTNTIKSNLNSDTIKMNVLYNKYCEWINIQYLNNNIIPQNKFTRIMNSLKIVDYKNNISNLNNTSGIINRKFC